MSRTKWCFSIISVFKQLFQLYSNFFNINASTSRKKVKIKIKFVLNNFFIYFKLIRKKMSKSKEHKENNELKPNKNNPDPIPFIQIKNEPTLNNTEEAAGQNNENSNLIDENKHESGQEVAVIQQDISINLAANNALINLDSESQINSSKIKQEDAFQINTFLTIRIDALKEEVERLKAENEAEKIRIFELEKEKSREIIELKKQSQKETELLNQIAKEMSALRVKIKNLEERLENGSSYSEQSNQEKRVILFAY